MSQSELGPAQAAGLEDVLITPELARRPARPPDYAAENRAMMELARRMSQADRMLLQALAEQTRQICQAYATGVSLLVNKPETGETFEWAALAGGMSTPERTGTMRRENSPSNIALERREPQLFREPGRHYAYIRAIEPPITELLIIPMFSGQQPLGTVWVVATGVHRGFDAEDARIASRLADFVGTSLEITRTLMHMHQLDQQLENALRTNNEIEASRARIEAILDQMPVGVILADAPSGRLTFTNKRCKQITGMAVEHLQGIHEYPAWRFRTADGQPLTPEQMSLSKAVLHGEVTWEAKRQFLRADGQWRWATVNAAPIHDTSGRIIAGVVAFDDCTEQKLAQEALEATERRLREQNRALAGLARTGSAVRCSVDDAFRELTEVAAKTLGVARVSVWLFDESRRSIRCHDLYDARTERHSCGQAISAAMHPKYFAAMQVDRAIVAHDAHVDERTCEFVASYLAPQGISSMIDVPIRLHGEIAGVVCHEHVGPPRQWTADEENFAASIGDLASLAMEAEESRRAEEALRASEARFRGVVESEVSGIAFWRADGTIIDANETFLSLVGYTREDLQAGRLRWDQITPPEYAPLDERMLAQVRQTGRSQPYEKEYIRKDGSRVPILTGSRTLPGTENLGVAFVVDITASKQAEKHMQRLLAELSHRVKNTLATVLAIAAQTRRRSHDLDTFFTAFEGRIHAMAKAHGLLSASQWRGADLHQLVEQSLHPHALLGRKNIDIEGPTVQLAPHAALIMSMVIYELATNAAKYGALSVPAGSVDVRWEKFDRQGRPCVRFQWLETGGPHVEMPAARGFGTDLIEQAVRYELKGQATLRFEPQGLRCEIDFHPDDDETGS